MAPVPAPELEQGSVLDREAMGRAALATRAPCPGREVLELSPSEAMAPALALEEMDNQAGLAVPAALDQEAREAVLVYRQCSVPRGPRRCPVSPWLLAALGPVRASRTWMELSRGREEARPQAGGPAAQERAGRAVQAMAPACPAVPATAPACSAVPAMAPASPAVPAMAPAHYRDRVEQQVSSQAPTRNRVRAGLADKVTGQPDRQERRDSRPGSTPRAGKQARARRWPRAMAPARAAVQATARGCLLARVVLQDSRVSTQHRGRAGRAARVIPVRPASLATAPVCLPDRAA